MRATLLEVCAVRAVYAQRFGMIPYANRIMGLAAVAAVHALVLALALREAELGPARLAAEGPPALVRIMSEPGADEPAGTLSLAPPEVVPLPAGELALPPIRIAERPRPGDLPAMRAGREAPFPLPAGAVRAAGALSWADYPEQVRAHLDRVQPPQGPREPVYVRFSVDRRGNILSAMPERAGTDPTLAAAAIRLLRAASPLPPVPQAFQGTSFAVTMAIEVARG